MSAEWTSSGPLPRVMSALLAVLFLTNLAATTATGQTVTPTTGAVFGTVTDSSHAVVPS